MESEETDADPTACGPTSAILKGYRQPPAIICSEGSDGNDENDSVLDDEPIPSTSKRIINKHHARWNMDASLLIDLKAWQKHYADHLARVSELITDGSSNIKVPRKPKRTVSQIENYENDNNKNKKPKNKKPEIEWKEMNANEFNDYLKQFIKSNYDETATAPEEMSHDTLESVTSMCIFIKEKFDNLNKTILKSSIKLGEYLIIFKARFDIINIQTNCKMTWKEALESETGMSASRARQYKNLAKLVHDYPGLGNLQICFTTFREMIPTIRKVFKDDRIGSQWA